MIPLIALAAFASPSILIRGGTVYDGSGKPGRVVDVRVVGSSIREIGHLRPRPGEQVIDAKGLAVAPGFIDAHSHADGGIFEDPDAETQVRQGITTAVVGEDGGSALPVRDFFGKLKAHPTALNFASFVGAGTVRHAVIGDKERKATPAELRRMSALVDENMRAGAEGLSTGLEYEPGRYADLNELVTLSKVAAKRKGIYISHMRNEDNFSIQAIKELIAISKQAHIPAQINHIKLCSARVWGKAPEVLGMMKAAHISADVYPYTYWQSTIRVIIPTEHFEDRKQWEQGLKDVGGPEHVLLTQYSPDPTWQGKTVAELASSTGKDAISVIQEIIAKCYQNGNKGSESVVVTAMSEADVRTFIGSPMIMFCSDGGLHGSHPRGAGSFPRVLGVYVREQHVIPLQEAIRKMTSLPASRFGFKDRGWIKPGYKADLVLFDPAKVKDMATTKDPQAKPMGLPTVLVNGVPVLLNQEITHKHPGMPLPKR